MSGNDQGLGPRLADFLRDRLGASYLIRDLDAIAGGWEADLFRVDVDPPLPDGLDRLVLRVYSGPSGPAKARREYEGIRLLREAGYPVPAAPASDPDGVAIDRPFIVLEFIDGSTMLAAMSDDPGRSQHWISQLVDLMARLHELDWQPFAERLQPDFAGDPSGLLIRRVDHLATQAERFPGFSAVAEWLRTETAGITQESPAVIHRDFHPDNVLLDRSGKPYVIDWTSIGVADRRIDLAWSLLLAGAYLGDRTRAAVEQSYRATTSLPVTDLGYFDVMAATIRLYQMVVSRTSRPEDAGMRPEAVEAMERDAGAYRWVAELLHRRTGLRVDEVDRLLSE